MCKKKNNNIGFQFNRLFQIGICLELFECDKRDICISNQKKEIIETRMLVPLLK